MLHTKFRGNRPAGSGEDFEGHMTSIMSSDFHFLVPENPVLIFKCSGPLANVKK